MSNASELTEVRRRLAMFASRKEARFNEFARERPIEWRPSSIMNPRTGFYVSPLEAWALIVDELTAGCALEEIELQQPPGRKAYAFLIELEPNSSRPPIYVKLELLGDRVIGRSFHYSTLGLIR